MGKSIIIKISIYLVITILSLLFYCIETAPLSTIKKYNNMVESDSIFTEKFDTLYNYPEFSGLVKEKIYKEALLKLSEDDSIQLAINIPDSTVSLYIKGVRIHHSKISYYEKDKVLESMPIIQQVYMFSKPISILSQKSTVVKEPIFVREAPKDTIEASLNAFQPDTLVQDPAFLILSVENGIDIILEQENNPTKNDQKVYSQFQRELKKSFFANSVKSVVKPKEESYIPRITIKIPADELRSIYRALPYYPLVALKIN